ncbi:MAG: NAD(+) synthase [Lachnospira eligens]|jgi:NAD+ synthetase
MSELNYEHVFNVLVDKTAEYVTSNNLKAMVLGISGGIDSTVVAAICHEVSKKTDIPLIGRSLPIKNKEDEFSVSELVGEAFCDEFKVFNLSNSYKASLFDLCADAGLIKDCKGYDWYWVSDLEELTGRTPIANGNLQARCRMKHLYDIASIRKGLVMSTDNQTEYQLGFWTIHGDVGDFDPIQDLWKTEVYGLANYLRDRYKSKALEALHNDYKETCDKYRAMSYAVYSSCKLIPTDGLGISNSDLEQIGAKSYDEVDDILSRYIPFKEYRQKHGEPLHPHDEMAESDCWSQLCVRHGEDVVNKVWSRHLASEFKRKKAPIYISRELYE